MAQPQQQQQPAPERSIAEDSLYREAIRKEALTAMQRGDSVPMELARITMEDPEVRFSRLMGLIKDAHWRAPRAWGKHRKVIDYPFCGQLVNVLRFDGGQLVHRFKGEPTHGKLGPRGGGSHV